MLLCDNRYSKYNYNFRPYNYSKIKDFVDYKGRLIAFKDEYPGVPYNEKHLFFKK